jgi:hypothetical protein
VISDILRFREEDAREIGEAVRQPDEEGLFALSSLFHGFPQFTADLEPIVIEAVGQERPVELSMRLGWFSEERTVDGSRRRVLKEPDLFGVVEAQPALVVRTDGMQRVIPLESFGRFYRSRPAGSIFSSDPRMTCVFVSPYGGERTANLGPLWDKIALSDRETDLVQALRIVDPEISAVSMVGGEETRQTRTAIVRAAGISRPVPLRSFGDGLNRLFGIVLSLVNAKDGLLLIDEFENGLHYSVQLDVWRAIFRLAQRLDIQVVATSHSWDAIEAFQKAASEDLEEGVLIRLSRKGDDVVPTLFREEELAIATRDRIEVR